MKFEAENKHGGAREGAGRKPGSRKAEFEIVLDEVMTPNHLRALLLSTLKSALAGDRAARQILLAYYVGKPVERKEVTGADGAPLLSAVLDDDALLLAADALRSAQNSPPTLTDNDADLDRLQPGGVPDDPQ